MSAESEFLAQNFPLSVQWDGGEAPIEWFGREGIASIAGRFVVKVFPTGGYLYTPPPAGERWYYRGDLYADAWNSLRVTITEHGVGLIDDQRFAFDSYLKSELRDNGVFAEYPTGFRLIHWVNPDYQVGLVPPFWKGKVPLSTAELLSSMQRYIRQWL